MPDWLDVTNGWAAIPLQVLGFGVTIWQLIKTRRAADAARLAAQGATESIRSNVLLVLLPQLSHIEANIEWAIGQSDRVALTHYLNNWRWHASQLRGLLTKLDEIDEKHVQTLIQQSITIAATTKLALQKDNPDILKVCRPVQKAIADVTGLIGELSTRESMKTGTSNE